MNTWILYVVLMGNPIHATQTTFGDKVMCEASAKEVVKLTARAYATCFKVNSN